MSAQQAPLAPPPARPPSDRDTAASELLEAAARTPDPDGRSELLDEVVLLHKDVAESLASRYRQRGIPEEDLCQAAYEGLVKAAQRFDPELRHDFMSFAVPTMRGEVQRYFRDHGWTVRPPRRIQDLQWRLHRAIDELSQELGREPTHEELLAELGVTDKELDQALLAYGAFRPTSLDQPVGEDGLSSLCDHIPDETRAAEASEARLMLAPLVRRLSPRDRRILYLRFCEDRTQQEIGDDIGVTQMQISRHLTRIIRELKEGLTDEPTPG
jgi:RNA polymerase sigma-B factor